MKLTTFLVITLYTVSFLVAGAFLIYCSLGLMSLPEVLKTVEDFYLTSKMNRAFTALIGALLALISVLFVIQLFEGLFRKKKSIDFTTTGGKINVSLSAVEDVVRRCGNQFIDLKEMKPRVIIKRKGLDIKCKVVLYADANIPELTENLHSLIKDRVSSVLGIKGEISVSILVTKVVDTPVKQIKKAGPSRKMEMGKQ